MIIFNLTMRLKGYFSTPIECVALCQALRDERDLEDKENLVPASRIYNRAGRKVIC